MIGERGQSSGKNSRKEYFSFEPKCSFGNSLYNHLGLHSQHMFSFLFSTFTSSASVSRFTNTVISGPHRVRSTGTVLPTGTLAWLQLGRKKYKSKCNGLLV